MLSNDDIQKLIQEFKIVFSTKEEQREFEEKMFERFDKLQTAVDAYKKQVNDENFVIYPSSFSADWQ